MNKIIVEVGSTCTKIDKFDGQNRSEERRVGKEC